MTAVVIKRIRHHTAQLICAVWCQNSRATEGRLTTTKQGDALDVCLWEEKKKNTFALVAVSLLDAVFFPVVGHAHSPRRVSHASLTMRWLTEWCLLCGNKRAWGYHMGWMGWHIRQSTFKSTADVYIRLVRQPWAAEMNGTFFFKTSPLVDCIGAFWLSARLSTWASPILCLIRSCLMCFVPSIA